MGKKKTPPQNKKKHPEAEDWKELGGQDYFSSPRWIGSTKKPRKEVTEEPPYRFFELFWDEEILIEIVNFTNAKANDPKTSAHEIKWVDLNVLELKAFLAVIIHMGLTKSPRFTMYWSKNPRFRN